MKSPKFIAFLLVELTWKALLVTMLVFHRGLIPAESWSLMMAVTLITGFMETIMLGGLSALDHYVKLAEIAAGRATHDTTPRN